MERFKIIIEKEYEANPKLYWPNNITPEKIAEIDKEGYERDPELLIAEIIRDGGYKIKIISIEDNHSVDHDVA